MRYNVLLILVLVIFVVAGAIWFSMRDITATESNSASPSSNQRKQQPQQQEKDPAPSPQRQQGRSSAKAVKKVSDYFQSSLNNNVTTAANNSLHPYHRPRQHQDLDKLLKRNGWKQNPKVPLPLSRDGVWIPTRCLEFSTLRGTCLFWSEGKFDPPLDAKRIHGEASELLALKKKAGRAGGSSSSSSSSSSPTAVRGFSAAWQQQSRSGKSKRTLPPAPPPPAASSPRLNYSDSRFARECIFEQLQASGSRMSFFKTKNDLGGGGGGGVFHKDNCGLVSPTRHDVLVAWAAASQRINQKASVSDVSQEEEEEEADTTPPKQNQNKQRQPYPKILFRADSLGRNKASNFVSIIRDWGYNLDRGHHGIHVYVVTTHRDAWFFQHASFKHASAWRVAKEKRWRTGSATCDFPSSSWPASFKVGEGEEILLVVHFCSHLGVERPVTVPRPLSQWTSVVLGTSAWDHGFHRLQRYVGFFASLMQLSERMPAGSLVILDGWTSGDDKDTRSPLRGQRIQAKRLAFQAFARLVAERGRATVVYNDAGALADRARAAGIHPLDDAGHFSCIIRPHVEVAFMTLAVRERWMDGGGPHVRGLEGSLSSSSTAVSKIAGEVCFDTFNRALLSIYSTYASALPPFEKPLQRWLAENALQKSLGGVGAGAVADSGISTKKKSKVVEAKWMEAANAVSPDAVGSAKLELDQLQPHLLGAADIYYSWRLASSLSNVFFALSVSNSSFRKHVRSIAFDPKWTCELHPALNDLQKRCCSSASLSKDSEQQQQQQTGTEFCHEIRDSMRKDAIALIRLSAASGTVTAALQNDLDSFSRRFLSSCEKALEKDSKIDAAFLVQHGCQQLSLFSRDLPLKRNFEGVLLSMSVDDLRWRLASWRVMGPLTKMEL